MKWQNEFICCLFMKRNVRSSTWISPTATEARSALVFILSQFKKKVFWDLMEQEIYLSRLLKKKISNTDFFGVGYASGHEHRKENKKERNYKVADKIMLSPFNSHCSIVTFRLQAINKTFSFLFLFHYW